jgi:hypothetical protein
MSAPSCLVFFGLRFDLSREEIEPVETRADERVVRARRSRLDHYMGKFVVDGKERWLLFVGKKIANVGPDTGLALDLDRADLERALEDTSRKLVEAGWSGPPRIFIQYEPD